jgi:hypothetical protein
VKALVEDHVTYPPSGQPYYPDQNQPQYGGHAGGPGADPGAYQQPYSGGPAYPQQQEAYGSEQSYTTEPPYSGQPYSAQPYSAQPYSAQPYSGQPYSAQPYSAAPYDQGYAPAAAPVPTPQYGQPAGYQQGYQQTPSFVTPPAQRRGSGGMIALIAGSAVLLLILLTVGGVVLLRSGDDDPGPSAANTPAPASAAPPASSAPAANAEYPARIDLPATVAGLTKIVGNATLDQTANDTALQIKTATNADSAVAAYYAPGGDLTRTVGLFGATGRITNPKGELEDAFTSDDLVVTGEQDVDPGPLGGYMKCGNTVSGGQALTVCGWSDGGSVMMAIFLNRSVTDSATLFRQIRGEILKRG